ncbi:MAG TPA: L,D-transpeptidase/peptidoglycan binding protein [Miltoncostaeaceae bacterium]|nr:L,D-transpeptidase/peptidoglycan binding protein [Miltoncostaeaceae bacterium]
MGSRRYGGTVVVALACAAALPALAGAQAPAPVAPVAPALPPGVIAPGVTIAGVQVGGLSRAAARVAVLAQYVAPRRATVPVTFRGRTLAIDPVKAGYAADLDYALDGALLFGRAKPVPPEGVTVPLRQKVDRKRLRAVLALRAARYDVPAKDASLSFKGATPVVSKPRVGIAIDVPRAATAVEQAILVRDRPVYPLPSKRVRPAVTSVGPAIIIERGAYRLTLWRAGKRRTFGIAVGQPAYPTPAGTFAIVTKQRDPTWFPPNSPWAAGLGPVPPGVSNPLGTRWMGTSAPAIGIHGTPVSGSIGTAASHGCIRMYIGDAEYLFDRIEIGTPVRIV